MKRALCLILAAATSVVCAAPPNIIILYADDMGFGDLGANNPASRIPTPNLDRLAAAGMNFADGHSSSGICSPSRYSLLTGRHHWRDFHHIVDGLGPSVFRKDRLTMPQMLRVKGYTTACIGKWHLGWNWDAIRKPGSPKRSINPADFDWTKPVPGGPLDRGFDHYFGDDVINFPPYAWIEGNILPRAPDIIFRQNPEPPKEGNWECRPGPALSDWDFKQVLPVLVQRTVDYVHSRKDAKQPFFLYVPFPSPHAPIIPNDGFDGKSAAGPYGDYVYQTDSACGRILKALDETGRSDNTIVVFTADNGAEIYATARREKYGHWSSAPFRGLKRDLYEGGHHVPFIVRWPGVIRPGGKSGALISQVDLMATFAALAGYELPRNAAEDSHNFLPYLRGKTESPPRTSMVHNTFADQYGIREGDWVLVNVRPKAPENDMQGLELYNLKEDIGQETNLADKHPDRVKSMRALLKKIREQGHSAPRLSAGAVSEKM